MGTSVEVYRARIGLYQASSRKLYSSSSSGPCRIKMGLILPSLTLCLLLLVMAGVQPNPGPVYKCKLCPSSNFSSVEAIFHHHKDSHLAVPCYHEGCSFSSVSLNSFKVHCSRSHSNIPSTSKCSFDGPCPVQNCTAPKPPNWKGHLEKHLDEGNSFQCPYSEECKTVHKQKTNFRVHLSQVHMVTERSPVTAPLVPSQDKLVDPPDPFPANKCKHEVLKFYLELEGLKVLPSQTVQFICDKIAFFSELSHHCLKRILKSELIVSGFPLSLINKVLLKTFSADPIFNVHHKDKDPDPLSSIHYRKKALKKMFAYVEHIEMQLLSDGTSKPKKAQYVPLRKSIETFLSDQSVKQAVLKSFTRQGVDDIIEDYRDGIAFKNHLAQNNHHKCIQLVFFMDAFEYNPFGPARSLYKTLGTYFYIGNLPSEFRSKVDNIFLAFLIQEAYLKQTEEEHLNGVNKLEEAFFKLYEDLEDLRKNGVVIDGETYPVCFLFCCADNLGAHQVGSFSQSFTAEHSCRYCSMTMTEFRENPHQCKPLRTAEEYDQCVAKAKILWDQLKEKAIKLQKRKLEIQAEKIAAGETITKKVPNTLVSKNMLQNLQRVNCEGIKPFASALNKIPGFHVSDNGLPMCLAHDLFEGCADTILAKILEHFVVQKGWFTKATLNQRIVSFKYKGKDADDSPNALTSFDNVNGHAVETWTLIRLLPLLIEDLIQDPEDDHWQLYLQLKEMCEFICAPKLHVKQVAYLQTLIEYFLLAVKRLLPNCLTPKAHFLSHYATLILTFGCPIWLWTMRFESRHVFFKLVAKMCHNFKNITFTLAQKYQYKFVLDHIYGFLSPEVVFVSEPKEVNVGLLSPDIVQSLPPMTKTAYDIEIKGTYYRNNLWMMLEKVDIVDLLAGQINQILILPDNTIQFVLRTYVARKSPSSGLYVVSEPVDTRVVNVSDLPDYFPLPAYDVKNKLCISLKHSFVFM